MIKTRFLLSLLFSLLIVLAFWIGGLDFNTRGYETLMCYLCSLLIFGVVYTVPYRFEDEND